MEPNSANEVLIVSDSGNKESNCLMYDLEKGPLIETYKDGHSVRNGLDLIGNDYLISAFDDKPRIKIWQFGQSSTVSHRMTTPGIVSALAVSKCGQYCIAGIGKVTYIWEVASGNLDSRLEYHIQDITCVKFSSDGSHFITGGKDGLVFVFLLSEAIIRRDLAHDIPKARFTWADHTAEVTDIYVGYISFYSRVATVSKDMTCMMYELDSGYHLCTVRMKVPLTTVAMDMCEYFLFLGSTKGNIYKINLFEMDEPEMHFDNDEKKNVFEGHQKEVTSLCISQSGKYLVSCSPDKQCIVWDIKNFTIIRKYNLQGTGTNVITTTLPPGIKNRKYVPHVYIEDFQKVVSMLRSEEPLVNITTQDLSLFHAGTPDQFFDSKVLNCSMDNLEKMTLTGSMTIDDLSRINNEIYSFALTDVFHKSIDNPENSN